MIFVSIVSCSSIPLSFLYNSEVAYYFSAFAYFTRIDLDIKSNQPSFTIQRNCEKCTFIIHYAFVERGPSPSIKSPSLLPSFLLLHQPTPFNDHISQQQLSLCRQLAPTFLQQANTHLLPASPKDRSHRTISSPSCCQRCLLKPFASLLSTQSANLLANNGLSYERPRGGRGSSNRALSLSLSPSPSPSQNQ